MTVSNVNQSKPSILSRALAAMAPALSLSIKSPEDWADSSHLIPVDLQSLFGWADASGIQISRRTAMGLDVVAKGRRVLATNLGRMSLVNFKAGARAPLQMAYLQQPEEDRPLAQTLIWTADALYFYPRTWWIVQRRDAYGWPARGGVKLLDRKDAEFDDDGKVIKAWGKPVEARDVIQFDAPDGGLLHDGLKTLRRAVVLDRAASLAEENPVPSVDIHNTGSTKLEADQIRALLASWQAARAKYGAAYSDKSIEVKTLGLDKEQLLLDAQNRMDVKLARQVGIPAWAADVALEGSTLNYQNRASRAWELIDLYLATYTTAIASRLSMNDCTPIGWSTEFDTEVLTRPELKTRFETYEIGLRAGFIDQAWIDAQEGQPMKQLEESPA
ncbi:phage portal protein [Microbacterium esteraromaticum]|uniref:Phage portal protein n=1 Tax=Microbacterium esteraromaticum TaxID=57043 RepID=A0A7D8AEE6_9MICO|nr:phage portal protein [Microbacterium esteraromaticum]QMU97984.1 phage portal protein [Microbacterium esteraromaticum]